MLPQMNISFMVSQTTCWFGKECKLQSNNYLPHLVGSGIVIALLPHCSKTAYNCYTLVNSLALAGHEPLHQMVKGVRRLYQYALPNVQNLITNQYSLAD